MHQLTRIQLTAVFRFIRKHRLLFDINTLGRNLGFEADETLGFMLAQLQHDGKEFDNWGMLLDQLSAEVQKRLLRMGEDFGVLRPNERKLELVPLQVEARVDRYDYEHNPHTAEAVRRQLVLELAKEIERSGGLEFTISNGSHQVSVRCNVEFIKQPR